MNQHVDTIQAAHDFFAETTKFIWQGQERELTQEECEHYAQAAADRYGLAWRWDDDDGIVFSAKQ